MKNRIALSIIALFILSACSTAPQVDSLDRIGTWDILSAERAKWNPVGSTSAYRVAFADSTSPDTTYFYDNGQIQAEVMEITKDTYEGEFAMHVTDNSLDVFTLSDSLEWSRTVVENIGDDFQIIGIRGTRLTPDYVRFQFQMNFNCNSTNSSTGNLILAFIKFQPDSVTTPPDTLFYYQLSTNGLYSTARYINKCMN